MAGGQRWEQNLAGRVHPSSTSSRAEPDLVPATHTPFGVAVDHGAHTVEHTVFVWVCRAVLIDTDPAHPATLPSEHVSLCGFHPLLSHCSLKPKLWANPDSLARRNFQHRSQSVLVQPSPTNPQFLTELKAQPRLPLA